MNSFLASGDFCRLLKTFANSLNPDQDSPVGPDLDPNHFDTLMIVFLKDFFGKKLILKKVSRQQQQKHEKLHSNQRVNLLVSET